MSKRIEAPTLLTVEGAKMRHYTLPVCKEGQYNITGILEALNKAVPHLNGCEIYDFHICRERGRYDASFTWRYPSNNYCCCTEYWGDGIYYLSGVTEDGTVVVIAFDDHCIINKENIGDLMAGELLDCLREEEEYSHKTVSPSGGVERLCRIPGKLTRAQLLSERAELILKRKKCLACMRHASGFGVFPWQRGIARVEEELRENKRLLDLVK